MTSQALLAVSLEALPVEAVPREGNRSGEPAPAPDVEPGAEPPASTAPEPGANAPDGSGGDQRRRQGGDDRKRGGEGERSEPARRDEAPAAAEVLAEQTAAEEVAEDGGDSTGVIVAAGLGGLALALAGRLVLVPPLPALTATVRPVDVDEAIRTRRTHKAYRPEPVPREVLDELFELARWAPNHNLTIPWRFRVLGPQALERLKEAAGPEAAAKLDRAPTLVVCSCALTDDDVQNEEDLHAAGVAAYIVLLGAHARGLGGYWRTPEILRERAGLEAVGVPEDERFVGLIHLGYAAGEKPAPERPPPDAVVTYLE